MEGEIADLIASLEMVPTDVEAVNISSTNLYRVIEHLTGRWEFVKCQRFLDSYVTFSAHRASQERGNNSYSGVMDAMKDLAVISFLVDRRSVYRQLGGSLEHTARVSYRKGKRWGAAMTLFSDYTGRSGKEIAKMCF